MFTDFPLYVTFIRAAFLSPPLMLRVTFQSLSWHRMGSRVFVSSAVHTFFQEPPFALSQYHRPTLKLYCRSTMA